MTGDVMDQLACTERIVERSPDAAIIANLGMSAYILAAAEDRDRNYYMRGAMGVTTPVGFGVANRFDGPVTVLEGDGSLLMSMGCLTTVSKYNPSNLTIVVMDNSEFATTGGQESLSEYADFPAVARACGLDASHVTDLDEFTAAYDAALASDNATLIACDVVSVKPEEFPPIDYPHSFLKHRFRTALLDESD